MSTNKKHRLTITMDDDLWQLLHGLAGRSYRDVHSYARWIIGEYCLPRRPREYSGPPLVNLENLRPAKHLTAKDIGAIAATLRDKEKGHGWVYFLESEINGETYYKIGKTSRPRDRYSAMAVQSPLSVNLVREVLVRDRHEAEKAAHKMMSDRRVKGEWFVMTLDEVDSVVRFLREHYGCSNG